MVIWTNCFQRDIFDEQRVNLLSKVSLNKGAGKSNNESLGMLIYNERNRQNVGRVELCAGLMSEGNLCKIETGGREPDSSTLTRLTDRLGMIFEDEGTYLFYNDYREWKRRWEIINAVENNELSTAESLISEYKSFYSRNVVRNQFAKVMQIQCEAKRGVDKAEIAEMYGDALRLTIPNIAIWNLKHLWLSVDELNIVLEYRFCTENAENADKCVAMFEDILKYMDNPRFSTSARAKIYPKTVVYMYRKLMTGRTVDEAVNELSNNMLTKLYKYCEKALDILREDAVRYYLAEILEIRLVFLEHVYSGDDAEKLVFQTKEWLGALRSLCREYGISEYTEDCCYFYKENTVYNIGDVIHDRRTMLGIKMEELAEQQWSCSLKTLRRLEHNRVNTHHDIAEELLEKLGLSAGYQRMGIITDDRRAIELYGKWKHLCNEFKYEECRTVLAELETLLPENLVNEQFIEWAKVNVRYGLRKMEYLDYIQALREILEKTVGIKSLEGDKKVFLSNNEEVIIYNISAKYKYNGDNQNALNGIKTIYDRYKDFDVDEAQKNIRSFELYMSYIASLLGSMGRYGVSDDVSRSVVKAQLKYGRIHMIHKNLSSMSWNAYQQNKDKKAYKDRLYQCMLWSQLRNDNYFTNRYRDRISQL